MPAERLDLDKAHLSALAHSGRSMSSPEAIIVARAIKDLGCSTEVARAVARLVKDGVPYDTAIAQMHSRTDLSVQPASREKRDTMGNGTMTIGTPTPEKDVTTSTVVNSYGPSEPSVVDNGDHSNGGYHEGGDSKDNVEDGDPERKNGNDVDHSREAVVEPRPPEGTRDPTLADTQPDPSSEIDQTHGDLCEDFDDNVDGTASAEFDGDGHDINNANETDAAREDDKPVHDKASDNEEEDNDDREISSEKPDQGESCKDDGRAQEDRVTFAHGSEEETHVVDDEASMTQAMGRLDLGAGSSSEPNCIPPLETQTEADKIDFNATGLTEESGGVWHGGNTRGTWSDVEVYHPHDGFSVPPTSHDRPLHVGAGIYDTNPSEGFDNLGFPTDYIPMPGWPPGSQSMSMRRKGSATDTHHGMSQSLIGSRDSITANTPPCSAESSVSQKRQSMYRSDLEVWPEAIQFKEQRHVKASNALKSFFGMSRDAVEIESLTRDPRSEESTRSFHSCFVPGCSVTRQHISILL
jgi:hypothetical protein